MSFKLLASASTHVVRMHICRSHTVLFTGEKIKTHRKWCRFDHSKVIGIMILLSIITKKLSKGSILGPEFLYDIFRYDDQ